MRRCMQASSNFKDLKLTDFFNVRKRRSSVNKGENVELSPKKCCHRGKPKTFTAAHYLPLGAFGCLPAELRQILFNYVSIDSLCVLFHCSEALALEVRSYLISPLARKRLISEAMHCTCIVKRHLKADHFSDWGSLIDVATKDLPLQNRLDVLSKLYVKNSTVDFCAKGWGKLFCVLYKNLSCSERLVFLDSILSMDNNSLRNLLKMVLEGPPGSFPNCEMKIRRQIRGFFLENFRQSEVNEVAFWMSAVIRTQKTPYCRGRLLFLLYGPLEYVEGEGEHIDWRVLVDTAIVTYTESLGYLKPLSDALYFLASSKFLPTSLQELTWNETDMFNIIEEITTSPEPWSFDNFASLILHRPCLIPLTFVPRVMNGFVDEAGQLFNTMKTLLYRWGLNGAKSIGRYVSYAMLAMPPLERFAFVAAVYQAFSGQLHDHLSAVPAAQLAFGEEIRAARSNSPLLRIIERFI